MSNQAIWALQVLRYLQAFAAAFQLSQYVRFNTEVVSAVPVASDSQQRQHEERLHSNQHASASGRDTSLTNDEPHGHESQLPWPKWRITTKAVPKRKLPSSNEHLLQQKTSNGNLSNHSNSSNGRSHHATTHSNGHAHTDTPHAAPTVSDGTDAQTDFTESNHSDAQTDFTVPNGSDAQTDSNSQTATYDALVVCNGHYSAPRCPDVKGSDAFPGQVMHSHNYRENEAFRGQTVVLVGASASGEDICREIAEVADKVTLFLPGKKDLS